MEKIIIGSGGFASEIRARLSGNKTKCFVEEQYLNGDFNVFSLRQIEPKHQEAIICIGDPALRQKIIQKLPENLKFFTFIDQTAQIHGNNVKIGEGSILCANSIITSNVTLGSHTQLNLSSTIGHDTIVGDYFTTAPGAKISGNCVIGNRVYLGTNASVREKINICDDVTIGLNAGVVKHITEPGIYIGIPSKRVR
jgi:sugar O-acyltransferase (sialic acid O-acetyltransferase NeuD family)